MTNEKKIAVALFAGLAAGAVLGVLFAPTKGSDLRRKIAEEGAKLADNVQSKLSACKGTCTEKESAA